MDKMLFHFLSPLLVSSNTHGEVVDQVWYILLARSMLSTATNSASGR